MIWPKFDNLGSFILIACICLTVCIGCSASKEITETDIDLNALRSFGIVADIFDTMTIQALPYSLEMNRDFVLRQNRSSENLAQNPSANNNSLPGKTKIDETCPPMKRITHRKIVISAQDSARITQNKTTIKKSSGEKISENNVCLGKKDEVKKIVLVTIMVILVSFLLSQRRRIVQ